MVRSAAQPGYPSIGRLKGMAELRGLITTLSEEEHLAKENFNRIAFTLRSAEGTHNPDYRDAPIFLKIEQCLILIYFTRRLYCH